MCRAAKLLLSCSNAPRFATAGGQVPTLPKRGHRSVGPRPLHALLVQLFQVSLHLVAAFAACGTSLPGRHRRTQFLTTRTEAALPIDGVGRPPHEDAVAPALQKLRIFERLQNNAAYRSFQPRESCRVRHAELRAGHFEKDAFQTLKSVDHARRRVHIQPPLGWRGRPRTQYVYHRL